MYPVLPAIIVVRGKEPKPSGKCQYWGKRRCRGGGVDARAGLLKDTFGSGKTESHHQV